MCVRFTAYKQRADHINQRFFLLLRFIVHIYVQPISFASHVAFYFNADRVQRDDEPHVAVLENWPCEDSHGSARGSRIINPN